MMAGLVGEAGRFRTQGVGVFDDALLMHMAPPAGLVAGQVADLIAWYGASTLHPLVRSAVFHYEFEFIHPLLRCELRRNAEQLHARLSS